MDVLINDETGYMIENEFYSYEDYAQLGGRMVKKQVVTDTTALIDIENEVSLVSTRQFATALTCVTVEGRTTFQVAGDDIKVMQPKKGSCRFTVKGESIKGKKKLILIQEIIRRSSVLDRGEWAEWETMVIMFNSKLFTVGFIKGESGACYMTKYNEYFDEENSEDYYKQLFKERTQHSFEQRKIELSSDAYGDALTGLGSIVGDAMEEQALDALTTLEGFLDESNMRDLVEDWYHTHFDESEPV